MRGGIAIARGRQGSGAGAQPTFAGAVDAFVARLNSGLTQLLQSTYLGGSGSDGANALAIHPENGRSVNQAPL